MLLASVVMTGCASMTADECKSANWKEVGVSDGLKGRPSSFLVERVNDCLKTGVRLDTALYADGRDQGLQNFCRFENAAVLGVNGTDYAGVCPAAVEVEFRRRYDTGHAVFDLRNKVSDLNNRGERLQKRVEETNKDEDRILKATDKYADRQRIRNEFEARYYNLSKESFELEREKQTTRSALQTAEYSLDSLRIKK